jgi:hypothetical protein
MSALKGLMYSVLDSLMVLAPPKFRRVELTFRDGPMGIRLDALTTTGDGQAQAPARPRLFIEPRAEARRLSEAYGELKVALAESGKTVSGPGALVVERGDGFIDVRLLHAPGGLLAYFNRVPQSELDQLLMHDALFDMVQGSEKAFDELQAGLEAKLNGVTQFAYDASAAMLQLRWADGRHVELAAHFLGQYLPAEFTWVWSWSQHSPTEPSVEAVRRICAPDQMPAGLSALWRPSYHCDEGFAWAVCGSVAVSLGARGLYRAAVENEAALFFAPAQLP